MHEPILASAFVSRQPLVAMHEHYLHAHLVTFRAIRERDGNSMRAWSPSGAVVSDGHMHRLILQRKMYSTTPDPAAHTLSLFADVTAMSCSELETAE